MYKIISCQDPDDAKVLWESLWPVRCFFDLWEVRNAFHRAFNRPLTFLAAEENNRPKGLIPLSWIEESGTFGFFPGETWQGKTWLEQNRIISPHPHVTAALLEAVPGPAHLRYLIHDSFFQTRGRVTQDEIGYLFIPGRYQYDFNAYLREFPGKTRKKILREISKLEQSGIVIRDDRPGDVDLLLKMNIAAFGPESYFSDPRFLKGFENLVSYMTRSGMMRITTVLIGGRPAAVDIGAVFRRQYTLIAGGTDPQFKGVAKLINLHHISQACVRKYSMVDFLCGDFNWKTRFRLTPQPLYAFRIHKKACATGTACA